MSPEIAASIDAIQVNMNAAGMNVINIVLAFVMFGVALGIKPETFVDVIKNPKSLIIGIACQMILLPGLTFLLTIALKDFISPMIALGMILVASCPGGNISNFITSLSRGNTELSVSLTAVNTAACMFTTPLNFALWGNLFLNHARIASTLPELSIPFWEIVKTIIILLGVPILLGVLCRKFIPKVADFLKKNPNVRLKVVGHPDVYYDADPEYNATLAEKRAKVVYETLVHKYKVDESRLEMGIDETVIQNFKTLREWIPAVNFEMMQ